MTASAAPVRAGLVGYGFAGRTFHAPLIAATPGIELVRVASSDAAKVWADWPGMAVAGDPLDLVSAGDLDLVVIASPNDSHAPLARAALEAGRHVVVDKPFTLDLPEARGLIALAKTRGRLLSVFHNRRWDSDFLSVRRAIEAGRIGAVSHFESHIDRFRPAVRERWREGAGPGAGLWFDLGPHLADQALQLFGLPDRVSGHLALQRAGALSPDWAHAILSYGEVRVILHAGMLVAGGSARFLAHGTGGSLLKRHADRQEAQLLAGRTPGAPGWGEDPDDLVLFDGAGGEAAVPATPGDQRLYYAGIVAALRSGAAPPVRAVEALAVMAVIEAVARSSRTGSAVEPDLTIEERAAFG